MKKESGQIRARALRLTIANRRKTMCALRGIEHERLASLAGEVRCFVDTTRALILRHFRIWTQRARPCRLALLQVRTDDLVRRLVILHPLHHRREPIHGTAPRTTIAVEHPRHHEETVEISRRRSHPPA